MGFNSKKIIIYKMKKILYNLIKSYQEWWRDWPVETQQPTSLMENEEWVMENK